MVQNRDLGDEDDSPQAESERCCDDPNRICPNDELCCLEDLLDELLKEV